MIFDPIELEIINSPNFMKFQKNDNMGTKIKASGGKEKV
jgi:hypothetical protein